MNVNNKLRELVVGAMLAALAIIIPVQFSFLRVIIPPFSATLASHVPMFVSMLIGPYAAAICGIGSVIGFIYSGLNIVVVARAATHIVAGISGALLIKKGRSMYTAFAVTMPIHAVLEALVVIPFGYTAYNVLIVVGAGTAIHHLIDAAISTAVLYALNPVLKLGLNRRKTRAL